jgi:hypothetical protein
LEKETMIVSPGRSYPVAFLLGLLWILLPGAARAQCTAWQYNVLLPKIGCSPQSIAQICSGRRAVPTNGSCPEVRADIPGTAESGTPYENFRAWAEGGGIDLRAHSTYTEAYMNQRTEQFCSMPRGGDMTGLMREVSFPPVVHWTETTRDRPRLEIGIMINGTPADCPDQEQTMRAFVNSVTR